jgi:chromosome segregation ATPase
VKKIIAVFISFSLVLTFAGCVSQKDYDELSGQYETAQSEISEFESDAEEKDKTIGNLSAQISEFKSDAKEKDETIDDLSEQISEVSDLIATKSELDEIKKELKKYLDENYQLEITRFSNDKKILRFYVTAWESPATDFSENFVELLAEISENIEDKGAISEFDYVIFEMWTTIGIFGTVQIETSTLDIKIFQEQ